MTLTMHIISGSPCGWRAQLGLVFKGLDYEVRHLNGSKREHKSPEFLSINPRGKVPVLETDGLILRDSIAILGWLDGAYPERPLFGATADESATIWQIVMECCEYLQDATNGVVFPVFGGDGSAPVSGSKEAKKLRAAADVLNAECQFLETTLDNKTFLGGAQVSAADAVAYPEIGRIQRAIATKPMTMAALGYDQFDTRYPRIANWQARVAELPGVGETVPIHWRSDNQ